MRRSSPGFTLLEVLIAMSILAIGLLVMGSVQADALRVSRYEEQQIRAASLARWKMVDVELKLDKDGFGDDEKEDKGSFAEDLDDHAYDGWDWSWKLSKVELPLPMDMLGGKKDGSDAGGKGGGGAPALPGGIDPKSAGEQLSKAVRVLKLVVTWKDGTVSQQLDVTTHLINFTQAAESFGGGAAAAPALPGTGGATPAATPGGGGHGTVH